MKCVGKNIFLFVVFIFIYCKFNAIMRALNSCDNVASKRITMTAQSIKLGMKLKSE